MINKRYLLKITAKQFRNAIWMHIAYLLTEKNDTVEFTFHQKKGNTEFVLIRKDTYLKQINKK